MGPTLLLCLAAVAGVDTGWQPLDGGGVEYIVQVTPDAVEQFKQKGYSADIPPEAQDVRRFVIFIGSGKLPRVGDATRKTPMATAKDFAIQIPEEHVQHLREGLATTVEGQQGVNHFSIVVGDEPAPKPEPPLRGNPFQSHSFPAAADDPGLKDIRGGGTRGFPTDAGATPPNASSPPRADGSAFGSTFGSNRPPAGAATAPWRNPGPSNPAENSASAGTGGNVNPSRALDFPSVSKQNPAPPTAADKAQPVSSPSDAVKPGAAEQSGPVSKAEDPGRPWAPLIVALLTLFGSLGANIYLTWLNWDSRARYKALLNEVHRQAPAA